MGKMTPFLKKTLPFVILLLISGSCFSQQNSLNSQTITPSEDFFITDDPDFMESQTPEQWQNESAVILCRKFNYSYLKKKNFHNTENYRVRVKLQDQDAVNQFSEFYYPYKANSIFGIRIIKKNGTIHMVDMSSSMVVVSNEVPIYFNNSNFSTYKKVRITNLEPGDLLDYKFYQTEEHPLNDGRSTIALTHFLPTTYPILKQCFTMQFPSELVFVGRIFNLNKTENNLHEEIEKNVHIFSFEDLNREKAKEEIWEYPTLDQPLIKMLLQVTPYNSMESKTFKKDSLQPYSTEFIQEKEVRNTQILTNFIEQYSDLKKLKKERENFNSDTEFAKELYYRLRDEYTLEKIQSSKGYDLSGNTFIVDDVSFSNTLSLILTKLNISHKLVVAPKRTTPSFDNVVFFNEMSRAIKVEDMCLFPFSNFTTHDHIPEILLGSQAMEFMYEYPFEMKNMPPIKMVLLPSKAYGQNLITNEHTINVHSDFNSLNTTVLRTFKGLSKVENTKNAVFQFNYLNPEEPTTEHVLKKEFQPNNSFPTSRNNQQVAIKGPIAKRQKKLAYLKNQRNIDYPVSSYTNFNLISTGRDEKNSNLIYEEQFIINGLIQPNKNQYDFEIGKLIGKQLELQLSDLDRESNIHLDFANGIQNTYLITLPKGFTISNLESLNFEVINSMGLFSCEASIHKNILKLSVNKFFKVQDADAKDWPQFAEIINTANTFTQVIVSIEKDH